MKVVDFNQFKQKKEAEAGQKKEAYLKMVEVRSTKDRDDFDHHFLELVDMFMIKYYPDYRWKFGIFLDEIEKGNNV